MRMRKLMQESRIGSRDVESVLRAVAGGFSAQSPHPNPLPRGEAINTQPPTPNTQFGRARLTSLLALGTLLFALGALPFIARSYAAGSDTANRSLLTAHSLSWLSEHAWMNPPAQVTGTDLRPL